ncbi:cytochrome b/b6 domain-containing protein [Streptomyces sp. Ag109_G2-15]|uniref:cytochrome b/b6 domain-containing protein n=1 Tax=Streptomyces sp. Ag109_G2-15 TaxID=1938850 RepID=UPI000BD034FC|nr:cytochrome b/b6 domain-containing protein [Streptomyces sp. Ag109_G2-15]SOD86676.1 DMSO/TMAO reductase YedYZ, heme-binding membrane subunit [Streptomyces sp. Ag109_G2-15]
MNPRRSNSSLPKPGRSAYGVASAVVLLLIPVVVLVGGSQFRDFLNFGAGVLSLVSLSCSVIWGLFAQDRIFLNTRQRIVGQAVHRTTAVASIAFLLLHITTKVALGHTQLIAAIIPFSLGVTGIGGLIGLGSLAGLLMIFVGITGALRSNFATPAPVAARWRAMHMLAYPAWCAALIHGLYAGRAAKPIFVILYSLSLLGVMGALALRAAPRPVKRKVADRLVTLLGSSERSALDDLDASRSRVAESGLAGFEGRREPKASPADSPAPAASPLYQTPAAPAPEPASGFAAAYRAVSTPGRPQQPFAAGQTTRMDLPLDLQATEAIPRVDGPSSTSGSWPIPSPPPVGEAPPSAYDPLQDTGYNIPVYGNSGTGGYGGSDMYDTGETNNLYGTYNSGDTYNSGPATEPTPGTSYETPGSGEPWNTPSGGYR